MKKKASCFAVLSAVCFVLHFFLDDFIYGPILYNERIIDTILNPLMWLFNIPIILFSVMLAQQKTNKVMFWSWSISAAISIIACIEQMSFSLRTRYGLYITYVISSPLMIVCLVLMTVMLSFLCLPKLKKYIDKITSIWFVPMALFISVWVVENCFDLIPGMFYGAITWPVSVISLVKVAAVIFFCLWLHNSIGEPTKIIESNILTVENNIPTVEATPAFSPADKLLQYKELLDSGLITQQEYDEKKKQLLDL